MKVRIFLASAAGDMTMSQSIAAQPHESLEPSMELCAGVQVMDRESRASPFELRLDHRVDSHS